MEYRSRFQQRVAGSSLVPVNLFSLIPPQWQKFADISVLDHISKNLSDEFLPNTDAIFKAFKLPPDKVKVLILGQDPYPNVKDAMGLAFSVGQNQQLPASLKNIFIELQDDLNIKRSNGDLSDWLDQGVMLLNMSLTVMPGVPASHSKIGWQKFTQPIVESLADKGVIGILWGNQAQEMSKYFKNGDSFTAPHPSPLSAYRGFFGSKPFSKVNDRLIEKGITPIKW